MTTLPSLSWWLGTTKVMLKRELAKRPDITQRLGHYQPLFINWYAKQYCALYPDLDNNIIGFENAILGKRLEYLHIPVYYRLRRYIFVRDNYTCRYCKQIGGTLELDHIIPLSKGGNNLEGNLTTACFKCNRQKRDKTEREFLFWKAMHA